MNRHVLLPGLVIFSLVAGAAGSTSAQLSAGERSVFVPIVPCRLFDTRAEAPVGARVAPLGPNETMTQAVRGTNGNCSIPADAREFARAVRGHWSIENSLHWSLDVNFGEDQCRVREGHAAENFAILRHLAINILKADTTLKRGIKGKQKSAGWNNAYLFSLLGV